MYKLLNYYYFFQNYLYYPALELMKHDNISIQISVSYLEIYLDKKSIYL